MSRKINTDSEIVQFAGYIKLARCRECGCKVKWQVRSTYKSANGMFRIQYLRCPECGAKAQRLIDLTDREQDD